MAPAEARGAAPAAPVASAPQQAHSGVVVSVRGSVVDIRVDAQRPTIHSVLRAGVDGQIIIEVLAHRDR